MNAPSEVTPKQLKELDIRIVGEPAPASAKVNIQRGSSFRTSRR